MNIFIVCAVVIFVSKTSSNNGDKLSQESNGKIRKLILCKNVQISPGARNFTPRDVFQDRRANVPKYFVSFNRYLNHYRRCKSDLRFQQRIYTFLLVNGKTFGKIGKLEANSISGKPITYKLASYHPFVKIGHKDGSIEVVRSPYSHRRSQLRAFRVSAIAPVSSRRRCKYSYCRRCVAYTWVRIIALRRYYGDCILRTRRVILSSKVRVNHISQNIGSNSLYRVVRWISPKVNKFSTNVSSAQARIDNACAKLSWTVKSHFKRYFPNVVISASMKDLFSPFTLRKLLSISRCPRRHINRTFCRVGAKYRSIDGTCNNIKYPHYGSSSSAFIRVIPAKYYDPDGMKDPLGTPGLPCAPKVPNPQEITKAFVINQLKPAVNKTRRQSHFTMQWGQFIDHDFTLAPESEDADKCRQHGCHERSKAFEPPCFTILPHKSSKCIHFTRSAAVCDKKRLGTREQMNANTAFIDASQIYGSTSELANNLRDLSPNKGLLKVRNSSHGMLLPEDTSQLMFPNNLCRQTGGCFLAGDVRSSEQMALAAIHTLFVREHNRIATKLMEINPQWSGNTVYEETRKIVGGIVQKITYEDYLPELLGENALPKYTGYKSSLNPGIINSVATAAYRFGHSTIRPTFDIVNENHQRVGAPIPLSQMFFNNTYINRHGIDYLLLGLCTFPSETVDRQFANGIMNHLFERKHSPGLNLIALNIQRGRDHGLPGYNEFRKYCNLGDARTFDDTANEIPEESRKILAKLYNNDPSIADLYVAGIAETPLKKSQLGPTFTCLIKEQFVRLRDGDRFFYKKFGVFTRFQREEIEKSSLSRILCDNLTKGNKVRVQENVFRVINDDVERLACYDIPNINLLHWKEITV